MYRHNTSESIELGAYLSDLPLRTSLHLNATHFDHSFPELKIKPKTKQPSYISGIFINNPTCGGVAPKPLVRLKNAIPISHILEEAYVELQRLSCRDQPPD
ncbi:UNVERIFIED_CONTAM: hypothetical protein Slati_2878600 [Sesamum latifolium]|uniref:Uncharacterized protein n=1 Tax=Sesamum latifolium TaxID=2727402 RepID=A0AAW2VD46_9LAMI